MNIPHVVNGLTILFLAPIYTFLALSVLDNFKVLVGTHRNKEKEIQFRGGTTQYKNYSFREQFGIPISCIRITMGSETLWAFSMFNDAILNQIQNQKPALQTQEHLFARAT